MSHADDASRVQPTMSELMGRYLQRQAEAQAAGLTAPDLTGEVVPFEAAPVQVVDPRLAWDEARVALQYLSTAAGGKLAAPPEWPVVVTSQEPAVALAFALGNFPQLVRHVQPLLHAGKPAELRPGVGRPIAAAVLVDWALKRKAFPEALLALGALRLARQFDRADELVNKLQNEVPADWQPAWANELAALAWHRGQADEAIRMWRQQPESVPVLFNRGMAALFLDQPAEARAALKKAAERLPETSGWHHLAQLYLALAAPRR